MSIQTVTHINFRGQAHAALSFYQQVFGGDATMFRYRDTGQPHEPADADRIVWGQVAAGNGFRVMAYDVPSQLPFAPGEHAFFVSVRGDDAREIECLWHGLAEGGEIVQPLAPSAWAALYGMLKDRFGVSWVLDVPAAHPG